jgi:hypothetical protein
MIFAGGDEGTVIKKRVYIQTNAEVVAPDSLPFRFAATIRNSLPNHTGTVLAPSLSSIYPNPFTVVKPSNLFGAHYIFELGFADQVSMDRVFPEDEYTFNIERTYASATTQFSQAVQFTGGEIPVAYPQISNSDWSETALWVHPSDARIFYTSASGVGFSWGIVGSNGSGGGSGSGAPGLLDLTGMLRFGQTLSAEFRFGRTDSAYTVTDPNAGEHEYQRESTYSALKLSVVQFTLRTPAAPTGFNLIEATYGSAGQSWDVSVMLRSKVEDNAIIYRMDEWELTGNSPTWADGSLYIKYENADGVFEGLVPFDRGNWQNYLIVPNPNHTIARISFSEWAKKHFSLIELTDLSLWNWDCDPDGDGKSNLEEFAFGLNPRASDVVTVQYPQVGFWSDSNGYRFLTITFRRNRIAEIDIAVQQSTDLISWPLLAGIETVEGIPGEPTVEKVTVRSTTPIKWFPRQFLRLLITDPNPAPAPPPTALLVILEARYGANGSYNDVTEIIEANIVDDSVSLQINNTTMGGDPIFGTAKELFIRYAYDGLEQTKTVSEGQTLSIP